MNRAARRKAEKLSMKSLGVGWVEIVEKHWKDTWHFSSVGLLVYKGV